ncbi:hypothetical protein [Microbacterium sp. 77mftsu3.1]|uniref:hypothetical protein n=1 Tax=Microbacterium sp. 77mftsu3.1 TaxID=1761802 RepID=UPI000371D348|nr:hypothetical protein [Microbacterium sp. 77mftsu3.1]SDH53720.1 hypothetical protein SAMN04488590_3510 [Microbacterium sp. 77mftsu3.1]
MTREMILHLHLPIALNQDESVKLLLNDCPNEALSADLHKFGFMRFGYPDEQLGHVEGINPLAIAAKQHANGVYKVNLIRGATSRTVAGDLLTVVRGYEPEATSATLVRVDSENEKLVLFQGQWIVWAEVTVAVEV